jgi:hypothetical protein
MQINQLLRDLENENARPNRPIRRRMRDFVCRLVWLCALMIGLITVLMM